MKKALSLVLTLAILIALPIASTAVDSIEMPTPPPEIEKIIEEVQTTYRLTIYYIYQDGSTAAPTYTEQLDEGTPYAVTSPTIEGYTPTRALVSGIMPARDMQYTVIYIPAPPKNPEDPTDEDPGTEDPEPDTGNPLKTIEDYEIPLGLGATMMNLGVCVD